MSRLVIYFLTFSVQWVHMDSMVSYVNLHLYDVCSLSLQLGMWFIDMTLQLCPSDPTLFLCRSSVVLMDL